jgi:Uma2 family endonuclease
MADSGRPRATYDQVESAPPHQVAEIVDGTLYVHPRPAGPHTLAASALGMALGPPFMWGRGGPGGWWIVDEPELHLGAAPDVVVPDLAGWRVTRMPDYPRAAFVVLAPDWACEVLSDRTRQLDRVGKMRVYAREQVPHVWNVDPIAETIEVFWLDGETYRVAGAYSGDARARIEPFEAIDLDLCAFWGRQPR